MLPRLVPEISPLYAFCDVVGVGVVVVVVVVGIGDSSSWIMQYYLITVSLTLTAKTTQSNFK